MATGTRPPSVALMSPGDRSDKITDPLASTDIDLTANPDRVADHDVVICDTPDREMFKTVAAKPLHGKPVLFRMRGDPFWGLDQWIESRSKRWLALEMLSYIDGCLPIADHHAKTFEEQTGVETRRVGLPIDVNAWPTATHTADELRIVTLTNAVYWDKIRPLVDVASFVDIILDDVGGQWRIGSWSAGHEDQLAAAVSHLDNVEYAGALDARDALAEANLMIHSSRFDVGEPNAILEGMASGLPVLTNDFEPFAEAYAPVEIFRDGSDIRATLRRFTDPGERAEVGRLGREYVRREHNPRRIGKQFRAAVDYFVNGSAPISQKKAKEAGD